MGIFTGDWLNGKVERLKLTFEKTARNPRKDVFKYNGDLYLVEAAIVQQIDNQSFRESNALSLPAYIFSNPAPQIFWYS